jgi:hypothetical protein
VRAEIRPSSTRAARTSWPTSISRSVRSPSAPQDRGEHDAADHLGHQRQDRADALQHDAGHDLGVSATITTIAAILNSRATYCSAQVRLGVLGPDRGRVRARRAVVRVRGQ